MTVDTARVAACIAEGKAHRSAGRVDEGRVAFTTALELLEAALVASPGDDDLRVQTAKACWQLFLLEPYREDGRPWLDRLRSHLLPLRDAEAFASATARGLWDNATHVLGTCLVDVDGEAQASVDLLG